MMCLKCGAIAAGGSDVCLAHGGKEGDIRRADANLEFGSCKCWDDSGDCDWCRLYYEEAG